MTAPRSLAVIAADIRSGQYVRAHEQMALADELVALDADYVLVPRDRWPSADEIAELREAVESLEMTNRFTHARRLTAFLDRLDPPTPAPVADDGPDWRALLAAVVAPVASGADMPDRMAAVDAARAALAAHPAPTEDGGR